MNSPIKMHNLGDKDSSSKIFIHLDNQAKACLLIIKKNITSQGLKDKTLFSISSRKDILLKNIVEFKSELQFDTTKIEAVLIKRIGCFKTIQIVKGVSTIILKK